MKNASPALIALLNGADQYFIADCLTVLPLTGSPLYLTSSAVDVTVESQVDSSVHTFKSGGVDAAGVVRPTFSRGAITSKIGTEVSTMSLALMSNVLALLDGLPWTQQAANGYLDGALICLERAFSASGDWSEGTLISFWGRVGAVSPSRNAISITVNSDLILLKRPMPRNMYQPGCLHNLYDAGCGLVKAAFTVSDAALSGSTPSVILSGLTQADGYFELGGITFTSGPNDGITRTVKTYTNSGGTVTVAPPFPYAVANGDTFDVWPGCDKTQATCSGKFSNLARNRSFPYVPTPEAGS